MASRSSSCPTVYVIYTTIRSRRNRFNDSFEEKTYAASICSEGGANDASTKSGGAEGGAGAAAQPASNNAMRKIPDLMRPIVAMRAPRRTARHETQGFLRLQPG